MTPHRLVPLSHALWLCFALGACGEKVVDLTPADAGVVNSEAPEEEIHCESRPEKDRVCVWCMRGEELVYRECLPALPPPMTPESPAPMMPESPPPVLTRCLIEQEPIHCVVCGFSDGHRERIACLACGDPGTLHMCVPCAWSDQDSQEPQCKVCDQGEGPSYQDCDKLRTEPLL